MYFVMLHSFYDKFIVQEIFNSGHKSKLRKLGSITFNFDYQRKLEGLEIIFSYFKVDWLIL